MLDLVAASPRPISRSQRRALLAWAAGVAALLLICLVAAVREQSTPAGIDALVEAAAALKTRPIDGRLSGGFPHRKALAATDLTFTAAVARILTKTENDAHASGVGYLLIGHQTDAIRALTSALCQAGQDCKDINSLVATSDRSALLNDFAAALLARHAAQPERTADLRVALNAAERSWQLSRSPESAWNRALALDKIRLEETSEAAWREYLRVDSTSGWAAEAQSRFAVRPKQGSGLWTDVRKIMSGEPSDSAIAAAVTAFPLQSRALVEDELLLRWARQVRAGDIERARATMRIVQQIGKFAARRGDHAIRDTLQLSTLPSFPDASELFARAREAYLAGKSQQAAADFREARKYIANDHAPLAIAAQIYEAGLEFNERHFRPALRLVREARTAIGGRRYRTLLAQTWWIEGLVKASQRDHAGAVEAYRVARELFEEVGERGGAAFMSTLLAENQRFAGDAEGAWRTLVGALRQARVLDSHERRYVLMSEIGKTAELTGDAYAAMVIYDRASAFATEHSLDAALADVAMARAEVAHKLDLEEAFSDLDRAARATEQIKNEAMKQRVTLDLAVTRGIVLGSSDPRAAIKSLRAAVDAYRKQQNSTKLPKALINLARAEDASGRVSQSERTLDDALSELERQRSTMRDSAARQLLMQSARPIADELVRRLWNDGRKAEALAVTERARNSGRDSIPDERSLIAKLPAATAHVVFYALPEKILVWIVTGGGVRAVECSITSKRLEQYVAAFDAAIDARSDAACTRALTDLHAAIFAPLDVSSAREVVFVLDGPLAHLPFAALVDRKSGRYLTQDALTRVAPSLTSLVIDLQDRAATLRRLLVIAPRGGGPNLGVETEIAAARRAFAQVTVQVERTITPERFLAEAPLASHLHFAGHATSAEQQTGYGHLVLGERADATVTAGEIAALELSSTRLVVLAACESGAGNATAEGSLTLSHAFLAAGARSVVGALWAVDDETASAFSQAVYEHLSTGRPIGEAVRAAQLDLLARPQFRSVIHWAAFQLWGHGETELMKEYR